MLKCRDIAARADEILSGELPWHRRVAVSVHLFMCERCRRFIDQYRRMINIVAQTEEPASDAEIARVLDGLSVSTGDIDTTRKR